MGSFASFAMKQTLRTLSFIVSAVLSFGVVADDGGIALVETVTSTDLLEYPIADARVNSDPSRIILVTMLYRPNAAGPGQYNPHPLATRFNMEQKRWTIVNQDGAPIPAGLGFVIQAFASSKLAFVHTATAANVAAHLTYLDHPELNGRPSATLLVTPRVLNGVARNLHPVGVFYDGSRSRWAIFNQDMAPLPIGFEFAIAIDATAVHVADTASARTNYTYLNDPRLDGNPAAKLLATAVWNPDGAPKGVYHPHEIGVWYDPSVRRWTVFNQDRIPMQVGAAFAYRIVSDGVTDSAGAGDQTTIVDGAAVAGTGRLRFIDVDWTLDDPKLRGWKASGSAFANAHRTTDSIAGAWLRPVALGGNYWMGPYPMGNHAGWVSSAASADAAATGSLTSAPFTVTTRYLSFLIAGARDLARLRVELQVLPRTPGGSLPTLIGRDEEYFITLVATGHSGTGFRREVFDLDPYRGHEARIRILDASSASDGYIAADDFEFRDDDPSAALVQTLIGLREPTAPLWGFADTHAHPAAHLAYAGGFIVGEPDGAMESALRFRAAAGPREFGDIPSSIVRLALDLAMGAGGGWPTFEAWPRASSTRFQQMHVDWLRRAHAGGLRVMVALAVNNPLLAKLVGGNTPADDVTSYRDQLAFLNGFIARHGDFMAIAHSPEELRRIVLQGKLAVVLGIEVEAIGNCQIDCTDAQLDATIDELERLGVRYVFPVHVTNNAFAGAAIYNDLFAVANSILTNQPFVVDLRDHVQYRLSDLAPFSMVSSGTVGEPGNRGHVNELGLQSTGRRLLDTLMRKGWLIDVDHMSEASLTETLAIAERFAPNGYPLMSGHTGIRALALSRTDTNDGRKLKSETLKSDEALARLARLGGLVAPITVPDDLHIWDRRIAACGGTSAAWAQSFLYAMNVMGGRNVALGTDFNGLVAHPGSRFGPNACAGVQEDDRRRALRPAQVSAQTNGVRYDRPVRSFVKQRFEGNAVTDEERDVWRALAWVETGSVPARLADPGPYDRWRNIAIGITATSESDPRLQCSEYGPAPGGCPSERRGAFFGRRASQLEARVTASSIGRRPLPRC